MKRQQARPIGDVIKEWMNQEPEMYEQLLSVEVERIIPEILGNLSRHLRGCNVYNRVLFLSISSASIRHALSLQKAQLIYRINTRIEANLVTDIVFR